jgi:LacI family transcriptional regulator
MKRKRTRSVALGHPISLPWMALFVRGVREYGRQHGGWVLTTTVAPMPDSNFAKLNGHTLKGWPGDGAILGISSRAEARAARRLDIPVVNLSGVLRNADLPRVMVDHYAIGRLAAEHLLERGLHRLAYCGASALWYSQQKCLGFAQRAKEAGTPCEIFNIPRGAGACRLWHPQGAPLGRWLKGLQRPVGLMAMNDHLACVVLDQCRQSGLNVPHEVALIGSDNDTIVCDFCQPTLSTVSRNAWRVGYEAAALLDRLMAGKSPPSHDILVPPDGVIARQSTDTVDVDDKKVAAAVRFMRDHLNKAVDVDQVSHHVAISRRRLEIRFRRHLGRSPHDYLCRLRVESAKTLLDRPELAKLQKIAATSGFASVQHLRQAFQRVAGMTPLEYHRQCQLHRIG